LLKNIETNKPQSNKQFAEYWWVKLGAKGKLHFGEKSYQKNEVMWIMSEINKIIDRG